MEYSIKIPKKLIEVALPLDAINVAAAREKSIRHGHPSMLHLWWARRPLAAARAVLFAQFVNDPSWKWELEHPGEVPANNLKASWAASRKRLFAIVEELVTWENTANEEVLEKARTEIRKSWRETCEANEDHPRASELFDSGVLPGLHDPFAGGGTIPLEAQRLGLEAYASDLNPVAVLINKAMIEIPPKFSAMPPINPEWLRLSEGEKVLRRWNGAQGLADDVRYYGNGLREDAEKRIGDLYPQIEVAAEMVKERPDLKPYLGTRLTVVAWLWARTVKSPNPAFRDIDVPLASTFLISSREEREAYVVPVVEGRQYKFTVKIGTPTDVQAAKDGTKLARANFACLMSGAPISGEYIKAEGKAGRMGTRLMAIVAEGARGRIYLSPTPNQEAAALKAAPTWRPDGEIATRMTGGNCTPYGLTSWGDLFTARQLVALTTFSDLVKETRERVIRDATMAGVPDDGRRLRDGGSRATAYADAVSVYLGMAIDKAADYNTSLVLWSPTRDQAKTTFSRQALPMAWDFAEINVFARAAGDIGVSIDGIARTLAFFSPGAGGHAFAQDSQTQALSRNKVVSTDPPYYDNIGYADLSDFFYVWLRRALKPVFPDLFATVAVPKAEELVATRHRHGSREKAERFFLEGMTQAMHRIAEQAHPAFPVTIYYAFKQSESDDEAGTASTGWDTFLAAVIKAGFAITGTWPMRTERSARSVGLDTNALASSIILVCRPRETNAVTTSRRAFLREVNRVLPLALDEMTRGSGDSRSPVAPVDLSQAIIGPGMAVFSKYSAVLEADGSPMNVKTALQLINRFLADDDFDHDTQFCLHWFEEYGWKEGPFGKADTLARAKGTSVDGVKHAGVLYATGGIVRLYKWAEYPIDWDASTDDRLPLWEALHQIIRMFKTDGESGAGKILSAMQSKAESTRQLAYRLYTLCERAGWAEDARAYNEIITSWSAIEAAASKAPTPEQATLFN